MARPISQRKLQQSLDRQDALPYQTILTTCSKCRQRKLARAPFCERCTAEYERALGHKIA